MLLGTGVQATGLFAGASRRIIRSQASVPVNTLSADRRTTAAISCVTNPSTLWCNGWDQVRATAVSWNITQTGVRPRVHRNRQKGKFIAFHPYVCGTYSTTIR